MTIIVRVCFLLVILNLFVYIVVTIFALLIINGKKMQIAEKYSTALNLFKFFTSLINTFTNFKLVIKHPVRSKVSK